MQVARSSLPRLKHRERRALRISHDGKCSNVLHLERLHVKFRAELLGFGRALLAVQGLDVDEPVWRSFGIQMPRRWHTANELLALLDVKVSVGRVFVLGLNLPAE